MKQSLLYLCAAAFATACVVPALAETVVFNQPVNVTDGFGFFSGLGASNVAGDNFQFASTTTIDQITWEGFTAEDDSPTFLVAFYGDVGNQPGFLVSAYNVGTGNPTLVDPNGTFADYHYTASFAPLTLAGATNYWVEVTSYTPQDFAWRTSSVGDGLHFEDGSAFGNTPTLVAPDLAFTLSSPDAARPPTTATPEPSSLILLGTGILCTIGAARRRFTA